MRKANTVALIVFVTASSNSFAAETCKPKAPFKTPAGELVETQCTAANDTPLRAFISLNGKKLVEDERLSEVDTADKSNFFWLFSGGVDKSTFCVARYHLIDMSTNPPTAITFGVTNACNQFDWASWGKSGSVIALKKNIRFKYRDGKMTPPKIDDLFLQTVAMPENTPDTGVSASNIAPFVQPAAAPSSR